MRVAIITENFLPKLDGVTRTLARLLEHLHGNGDQALLLGPDSGMERYAGAEVVGTAGVPLPFYPELKFNFFRPLFIRRLNEFQPHIVHLVDPVVLGAAGLAAARFLNKPVVSSYHTNLAAYCGHFGFPIFTRPMWSYNRFIHNQGALTFCPSPSTADMLRKQGFQHLRIWPRGVDTALFHPTRRDLALRASWLEESSRQVQPEQILLANPSPAHYVGRGGRSPSGSQAHRRSIRLPCDQVGERPPGSTADTVRQQYPAQRTQQEHKVVLLYAGRISWEKNLRLLTQAYRGMNHERCHLVIVGHGPAFNEVQQELAGLPVTFTGYLKGEGLAAAFASADIFAFPSRTETFGQVVLEAMASALPVVGLLSEGVCDLVSDNYSGYLLNADGLSEEEQVNAYRERLEHLVAHTALRQAMGQIALCEARQRSWPEAMQRLLQGYAEVIAGATPLIAA